MTGEYTFVTPERQNELTRRIQRKLAVAAKKTEMNAVVRFAFNNAGVDSVTVGYKNLLRSTKPLKI
jgi:hypothetical protein